MFSYHQKNVHSYVKADDPNRFFFLFKSHLLSKVVFTRSETFSQPLKQPKLSARQLVNISRNACNSAGISRPTAIHVRSIIIIIVVVVVDDDTYYWVYLSSDHLFQVYYKVRWSFITKCDGLLLQSATAFLLQSATITKKCDTTLYLPNRQFCTSFYKELGLFQTINYAIC